LPSDTTGLHNNTHLPPCSSAKGCTNKPDPILAKEKLGLNQPPLPSITISAKPTCHLLEHSFAAEEDQKTPAEFTRVYTITSHHGMLMSSGQGSKESLELDILKEKSRSGGTSVSAHNIRSLGDSGKGEAECSGLACDSCSGAPSRSQGSLDLESTSREAGKQHRRLERMWSVDRVTGLERGERVEDTEEARGTEIQKGKGLGGGPVSGLTGN
ncbi:hypothetical protein XENOCAPTIV_027431, partial [Xenoophorus captivus]